MVCKYWDIIHCGPDLPLFKCVWILLLEGSDLKQPSAFIAVIIIGKYYKQMCIRVFLRGYFFNSRWLLHIPTHTAFCLYYMPIIVRAMKCAVTSRDKWADPDLGLVRALKLWCKLSIYYSSRYLSVHRCLGIWFQWRSQWHRPPWSCGTRIGRCGC